MRAPLLSLSLSLSCVTCCARAIVAVVLTLYTAEIDAFVFGSEMFTAPFNTCGTGQQIDVLGLTTATVRSRCMRTPVVICAGHITIYNVTTPTPFRRSIAFRVPLPRQVPMAATLHKASAAPRL